MAEARISAEQDYVNGMKYKEIAEKYGVSLNTVKSWKQRYGWERKKGAHKPERVHTNKGGAPKGNKNAVGNRGGPGGPPGNDKAVTHGFFRKYLPADSLEIMEQLQTKAPLDIVWENIMIQYTAIIRAQQIMYVRDRDDKTVEKIEEKDGNVIGERWEVQQAWDKQATFLQAQSRAMGTLQSLIKQYDELLKTELATEEQELRIARLKLEVKDLRGDSDSDAHAQGGGYAEALNAQAADVFADEVDHGEET
ncbi:phage terminase small subunit [Paenibacillus sp. FSL R5-0810]|uniref:phage terminase small subunit n=1 Tax=Paenibacillus sp. FSL R5-0810 TaxID=2921659 RepID=UPI0030F79736